MAILAGKQEFAHGNLQVGFFTKLTHGGLNCTFAKLNAPAGRRPKKARPEALVVYQQDCTLLNTNPATTHAQLVAIGPVNLILNRHGSKVWNSEAR